MIKSIPCLRQKSRKTYPGWTHVPIKPLQGSTSPGIGANLVHIQPENLQNVQKMRFRQKALTIKGQGRIQDFS